MSMLPNTLMHLIREHDMTPDELTRSGFAAPPATRSQPSSRRKSWRSPATPSAKATADRDWSGRAQSADGGG